MISTSNATLEVPTLCPCFGTLNTLVADNLAAHTIGGYFCNFSTVHRFCRFCNCCKD